MEFLGVAAAYLIGSIDFAVVVARSRGVDIHTVGSGNPGTSNVLRTLGRGPAAVVFIGDLLKGVIAAAIGFALGGSAAWSMAGGFAVVLGHCYPIFHRFRGGRGVATSAGVVLWAMPLVALVLLAVFAVVVRLTKVASIGSLTVVVLSIPGALISGLRREALAWYLAMLALVVYRHRANIARMIRGTEQRVPT